MSYILRVAKKIEAKLNKFANESDFVKLQPENEEISNIEKSVQILYQDLEYRALMACRGSFTPELQTFFVEKFLPEIEKKVKESAEQFIPQFPNTNKILVDQINLIPQKFLQKLHRSVDSLNKELNETEKTLENNIRKTDEDIKKIEKSYYPREMSSVDKASLIRTSFKNFLQLVDSEINKPQFNKIEGRKNRMLKYWKARFRTIIDDKDLQYLWQDLGPSKI